MLINDIDVHDIIHLTDGQLLVSHSLHLKQIEISGSCPGLLREHSLCQERSAPFRDFGL